MMTIRLNGENLINFQRASATRSIETLCSYFNFTSTADHKDSFPVKVDDFVEILTNGFVVITGFVDRILPWYNAKRHRITVYGRDITQDFVDSSVRNTKEFTGGTLESITRIVLNDLGLTDIKIINNAGTIEPFSSDEIQSAEPGENAFSFVEKYARKRQVLLTTDGYGNIIFTRASTDPPKTKLVMRRGRSDNNILSASFEEDRSNQFSEYYVISQENLTFSLATFDMQSVNQAGVAFDKNVRSTRYLEINAEDSMKSETAAERATWEANFRRSVSKSYRPLVQGFMNGSEPWKPNVLVNIHDEFANFSGDKLVKEVNYNYSIRKGSLTRLSTTSKDAFTLKAVQDQRESQRNKEGDEFIW